MAVNCARIDSDLIERELFGREKGAFASAPARKLGRFDRANVGTLFLDEISVLTGRVRRRYHASCRNVSSSE